MSDPVVDVQTIRMATGGEAVAHLPDGKVLFVRGALPTEQVRVRVTEEKKRFARGVAVEVLSPSLSRVDPRCRHARVDECGGCDWMHFDPAAQVEAKRRLVVEQLQRLGGQGDPAVLATSPIPAERTTARCAVVDGRAGYRMRRSNDAFVAQQCPVTHPLLEELITDGRYGTAGEVTLRVGAATGERMAVVDGPLDRVVVPPDVSVVSATGRSDAVVHELVAGRSWRISSSSFFQSSREGAEALVAAVARALAGTAGSVADLYGGVGLLGGAAAPDRLAVLVEQSRFAAADARANLSESTEVVNSSVETWAAQTVDTVIADPARRGLGKGGADAVAATGCGRLVLVSCDVASLGRDTALLAERGYRFAGAELVDMFPETSQVEVVSRFDR